jgi:hypothetical protein
VKKNEMGGACGTYGREKRCIKCFERILEETRLLVKPRNRLEYNIKIDLHNIEWGSWAGLIWLRIRTVSGPL